MSNHTKEPWRLGNGNCIVADEPVVGMAGSEAVEYYGGHLVAESLVKSNAERIVACVNACAGIDNKYLESPDNLATYARKMAIQSDELLAILKEAKSLIKAWHGEPAWDIYDSRSPEMKRINDFIAKVEGK